jgi:hypothetical protein
MDRSSSRQSPGAGNEEEAAREFERVLVKQFVQVMTKDLFKSIDEDAPPPSVPTETSSETH